MGPGDNYYFTQILLSLTSHMYVSLGTQQRSAGPKKTCVSLTAVHATRPPVVLTRAVKINAQGEPHRAVHTNMCNLGNPRRPRVDCTHGSRASYATIAPLTRTRMSSVLERSCSKAFVDQIGPNLTPPSSPAAPASPPHTLRHRQRSPPRGVSHRYACRDGAG